MTKIYTNSVALTNDTYKNCKSIVNVDLHNTAWVSNSMYEAFRDCTNLQSITNINKNVYTVTWAFGDCSNLKSIDALPTNISSLYCTFIRCTSLTNSPTIPDSVSEMSSTFCGCTNLVNIPSIPNSVHNLGEAFKWCTSIKSLPTIPNSVTYMYGMCDGCTALTTVPTFENGITALPYVFNNCTSLTAIPNLPTTITNLYSTFSGCTNITGAIYLNTPNVTNAVNCFYGTTKEKKVYIPFYSNDVLSTTYNSFTAAGYKDDGSVCGVYLKDIDGYLFKIDQTPSTAYVGMFNEDTGATVDLSAFTYTNTNNNIEIQTLNTTATDIVIPSIYTETNKLRLLDDATIDYKVMEEGYTTVTGTQEVTKSITVPVSLERITCKVTVKCILMDATVTITSGSQTSTTGEITVDYGSEVTYTVSKEHYVTVQNTVTVKCDSTYDVILTPESHTITITTTPDDAVVEFFVDGKMINGTMTDWTFIADNPNDDVELQTYTGTATDVILPTQFTTTNSVTVIYGTVLTYVVKRDNYATVTETITVEGDQTINVTMRFWEIDVTDYTTEVINDIVYLVGYTGTDKDIIVPIPE